MHSWWCCRRRGIIEYVVTLVCWSKQLELYVSAEMIHLYIVQLTLDGSSDNCDILNSNDVDCFIAQECTVDLPLCDGIVWQFKPISIWWYLRRRWTLSFFGLKEKIWQDYVHVQTKPQRFIAWKSTCELGAGMERFGLVAVIVRTSSAMIFMQRSISLIFNWWNLNNQVLVLE